MNGYEARPNRSVVASRVAVPSRVAVLGSSSPQRQSERVNTLDEQEPAALEALRWQFRMAWSLARVYLPKLTDEICLWEPAPGAWNIREVDGKWVPDWSDEEPEGLTTSCGWLTWHIAWWWTEAIASFDGREPAGRAAVEFPGSADGVREQLGDLASRWQRILDDLSAGDLRRPSRFPWSDDRPFGTTLAWLNAELMKNIAEIGLTIRLYKAQAGTPT